MFTAYFDESDSKVASVVAGVIGEAGQLVHFEREWRDLLKDEGLQAFHMKDFAHSNREFSSWKGDERRRQNFLARVIGIISRRTRFTVGILLDRNAYAQVAHRAIYADFYVNEYTACAYLSLLRSSKWATENAITEPLAFVFDDGNAKRADFHRAFDLTKMIGVGRQYHFGSLTFADDKLVAPLQAADFIAYEFCKVYTDCRKPWCSTLNILKKLL